jgi:hypothetical protein
MELDVLVQLMESREQEERLANLRKYCQNILTSLSDDVEWIQEYRLTRNEAYITSKNMNKEERKPFSRRICHSHGENNRVGKWCSPWRK